MHIQPNLDLDDVIRSDLRTQGFLHPRDEAVVEIFPGVTLFEVRIHTGKWGRHNLLPVRIASRNLRELAAHCNRAGISLTRKRPVQGPPKMPLSAAVAATQVRIF